MRNIANDNRIDASGSIIPASSGLSLGSSVSHWAELHVDQVCMDGDGVAGVYWKPSSYTLRNVFDQNNTVLRWEGGLDPSFSVLMSLDVSNSQLSVGSLYLEEVNAEVEIVGSNSSQLLFRGGSSQNPSFRWEFDPAFGVMYARVRDNSSGSVVTSTHFECSTGRQRPRQDIIPVTTQSIDLGSGTYEMNDIYAVSTVISSDQRWKTDISDLDSRSVAFCRALRPRTYKQVNGSSGRCHTGFVSQEVASALNQAGFSASTQALWVKQLVDDDGNAVTDGKESLRYEQLMAHMLVYIQSLESRLALLEV